jgi:hypothetical protein
MTAAAPGETMATFFQTGGFGAKGTDIFIGPERPSDIAKIATGIPPAAIFCRPTGGPAPSPYMHTTRPSMYFCSVQVIVRGEKDSEEATRLKARDMLVRTQAAAGSAVGSFLGTEVMESEPNDVERNDKEQPRYTFNVRLWIKQTT